MKIVQAFSVLFFFLFASYVYADRPWPGSSPEGPRDADGNLKTAIPDLPLSVLTYDENGKPLGFTVKNPDGIGAFRFGDKCYLSNGSPVKFLAMAIMPEDADILDREVYVEYMGGVQLAPQFLPIKETFCPEHAVVAMLLKDYRSFGHSTPRVTEEKKYLRTIILENVRNKH